MVNAILIATRHSCLKRGVGAVLVKNKRIIGTGYNGAASGLASCRDLGYCYYEKLANDEFQKNGGDKENIRERFKLFCQAVHAEPNAMSQCSQGEAEGAELFITNYPCPHCTQDIIITNHLSGIRVWKEYLTNPTLTIDEKRASEHKLLEAGISVKHISLSKERIIEIAQYMAVVIGERTDYKFV